MERVLGLQAEGQEKVRASTMQCSMPGDLKGCLLIGINEFECRVTLNAGESLSNLRATSLPSKIVQSRSRVECC
jgi:hypothetical protein